MAAAAMIDAALDEALPTSDETTEAPETGGFEAAAPEEAAPQDEPVPQPEGDGQPAATPPEGTEAAPYQTTPDGASFIIPKAEWQGFEGVRTYAKEVQQIFPTAGDAVIASKGHQLLETVLSEWQDGGDPGIDGVLDWFAGSTATDPINKSKSEAAFARMAERMPGVLQRINPQAHQRLGDSFVQARIDSAYDRALREGNINDPNDPLVKAAQRLDFAHTGQYRTNDPELQREYGAQGFRQDVQRPAVDQRTQQLDQRETAQFNRDWGYYDKTTVNGPKWTEFNNELDRTLEPIKAQYQPEVFAAVKDKIRNDLLGKLKEDEYWSTRQANAWTAIQSGFRNLWSQNKAPDSLKTNIQRYHNDFMGRVRQILPSVAAPLLNQAAASKGAPAPASAAMPPKTPTPAGPPRDANGQFQKKYDSIQENPKWNALFR